MNNRRFGIKEVADVFFYDINDMGNAGEPVLCLDTLKVSNIEQTAETVDASGGKGNANLIIWDYNKEINIQLQDALLSDRTLNMMYENNVEDSNSITISANTFPGVYYVVGETFARSMETGKDESFRFVIPRAKIQSESTISMEAEGDPSVFDMNLRVLRGEGGEMMRLYKAQPFELDTSKYKILEQGKAGPFATYTVFTQENFANSGTTGPRCMVVDGYGPVDLEQISDASYVLIYGGVSVPQEFFQHSTNTFNYYDLERVDQSNPFYSFLNTDYGDGKFYLTKDRKTLLMAWASSSDMVIPESVEKFSKKSIRGSYERYYFPSNMPSLPEGGFWEDAVPPRGNVCCIFGTGFNSLKKQGLSDLFDSINLNLYFKGNAPKIESDLLASYTQGSTHFYYPAGNKTWESLIGQKFGGQGPVTWTPWGFTFEDIEETEDEVSLVAIDSMMTHGKVVIPNEYNGKKVTKIEADVFASTEITEVMLPKYLKEIGDNAFLGTRNLRNIVLPETLLSIGQKAFYQSGLSHLTLPKNVQTVHMYAFCDTKIQNLVVKNLNTDLSPYAFSSCEGLKNITIPVKSAEFPYEGVFNGSSNIESITILEGSTVAPSLPNNAKIKKLDIAGTVTNFPSMGYFGMRSLEEVVIRPGDLKTIGSVWFSECANLKKIDLPNNIEQIHSGAFAHSGLSKIILPSKLKLLGGTVFSGTSITHLTIPKTVESMDSTTLHYMNKLEKVIVKTQAESVLNNQPWGAPETTEIILEGSK